MKKYFAVLLVILMILPSALISVMAENEEIPVFTVESTEGIPGKTVVVTVSVKNPVTVTSMSLSPIYPEGMLTLVKTEWLITDANIKEGGTIEEPDAVVAFEKKTTVSGAVLRMEFTVKEDAVIDNAFDISVKAVTKVIEEDGGETIHSSEEEGIVVEKGEVIIVKGGSIIRCASVNLATDISINYYAEVCEEDAGAQMRFTMNGKETLVDGTFDEAYGLYVFLFTGITPQCMGDTIKAELVKDGEVLDVKDDYSVLQNCKNLIDKTADELGLTDSQYAAMKTLIADLMEYGAAAQVYRGYKADSPDSLMNKDETIAELTPTTFTELVDSDDTPISAFLDPEPSGNTTIVSAGVYFDYINSLYVHFITPDVDTIYFSVTSEFYDGCEYTPEDYIQLEDGSYIFRLEPMCASLMSMSDGMNVEYTIVMKRKSGSRKTTVQTLNYSLAAYVYSKQDDDTAASALAKALYNYGLSAANYMAAIEK